MNFYFFDFNYFRQFFGFFAITYKIISAVFWLGIILDGLLKSYIKLYLYWIGSSSNMKVGVGGGGVTLIHLE